jgi:hypothetical protein
MQSVDGWFYGIAKMDKQEYDAALSVKGVKPSIANPM